MGCSVFGHICPVVYSAESWTETTADRRTGRYIPFQTKMHVVRGDNYTGQHCYKHLQDNEVEFDHIIPLAKGGSALYLCWSVRRSAIDAEHFPSDFI